VIEAEYVCLVINELCSRSGPALATAQLDCCAER
jgi:hypothetical protein